MIRAVLAALLIALSWPAWAAPCATRASVLAFAERQYDERPAHAGLSGQVHIVELLLSESGSWTIIRTDTRGVSCVLASGKDWHMTGVIVPGKGA